MSFALNASQCPSPTYPTAAPTIATSSSSATNAPTLQAVVQGTTSFAQILNQNSAAIAGAMGFGGNGYGVVDGLTLSTGTGLALAVSAGHGISMGIVEYGGGTYTVPNSLSLGFLWLLQNGTLSYTTTTTAPAPSAIYIGNFTTSGGNVTAVDYSGVVYMRTGNAFRSTNDRGSPTDTPSSSMSLYTTTQAGTYLWSGTQHVPQGTTVYTASISGTFTIAPTDAQILVLTPTSANQTVLLPSAPLASQALQIVNGTATGGYSLVLKDPTGTTTLATMSAGQFTSPTYPTVNSSGVTGFSVNTTFWGAQLHSRS